MAGLQPYIPSAAQPWNKQRVIHFFRRLGFGGTPALVSEALAANPDAYIESVFNNIKNRPLPTPPSWANYTTADYNASSNADLKFDHRDELYNSIYADMLSDGFRSKLFLFWHNHFVTELQVYDCNRYLWNYYNLLVKYSLGNFKLFVSDMGKAPAMLVYLNGNQNEAGKPNENYARELMELFTMGENNGYTQFDIADVARALTGWKCNQYTCNEVTFVGSKFDNKNKTIFGKTGNWGYNDVQNLIFTERKNQVAYHICEKIYTHFVFQKPDVEFVTELANLFIQSNWELYAVFKALFKSDHFFKEEFIGAMIKSPIDCFIDLARMSGINPANFIERYGTFRYGASNLGMEIFNPINVAGWKGHHEWINENTLTQRWNYCKTIIGTMSNQTNRESLRNLAINLSAPEINDPDKITRVLTLHFIGREISQPLHDAALLYFKGDIPQNYFEDKTWNLNWNEAPFQVANLLGYLVKLPEFQLS
jgi:uncharacterized protein (DUF1800 family)